MSHHCEIINCECAHHSASNKDANPYPEGNSPFLAKQESPIGKYPTL